MTTDQDKGWIQNLTERRFFQYFITYVAVSWGLIQAIDWAVKRYDLNPSLVDASLLFFVAILPAVVMFTYYHGRPGKDQWRPIEKIAIPINLAVAIGLAGFVGFTSGSPEPVTEKVALVDEDGQAMERIIYNRSLNNRAMIFPAWSGQQNDPNWLDLTIPILQEADLEQDPRISILGPIGMSEALADYNKELREELSFSIKRSVAEDQNVDFFIDIIQTKSGDEYDVTYKVYNTSDAKERLTKQYVNTDLFAIIDGFSQDLNEHLYSNLGETEQLIELPDLPVRELKSDNLEAVIKYVKARYTYRIENNNPKAMGLIDEVISLDSDFMSAYHEKGSMLAAQGNVVEGLENFNKAVELFGGQPERTTLAIKCQKYLFSNDVEKALRIGQMWQKLYPQTPEVYKILNIIYQISGEFDKRIELWKSAYDAGIKSGVLIELGKLYSTKGEYAEAEKYFEEYQQLYPSKKGEVTELGNLYSQQGKFEEAIQYFEDILLRDDQKVGNYLNLSNVFIRKGDFPSAHDLYTDALTYANSIQDSVNIYSNICNLLYLEGKAKDYIATDKTRIELYSKVAPPVVIDLQYYNFLTVGRYVNCGEKELIRSHLDTISERTEMGDIDWPCVINLNYALGASDTVLLDETYSRCPKDIAQGISPLQTFLINGIADQIRGNHETALTKFSSYIEQSGQPRSEMLYFIAPSNNALGNYDENIAELTNHHISQKSEAHSFVHLARAYAGKGDVPKAKEALSEAMAIWKNADDVFIPFQEAKSLQAELN